MWNLTGLFMYDAFILDFIRKVRDHLQVTPFSWVHGAPLSYVWNGGRVDPAYRISRQEVEKRLDSYSKLGTGCLLTFTNRFIEKKDLQDPDCNHLLEKLQDQGNGRQGVIVSSDLLADYIGAKCPGLHQMASIIKVTCEQGEGDLSYYRSLESRFDSYVVDVNDNNNFALLEKLDKSKAEILVNSCCIYHCPYKAEHYDLLSKLQSRESGVTMEKVLDYQQLNCRAYPAGRQLGKARNHCLTNEELHILYEMGFRRFKLQGRQTTALGGILYDICNYVFSQDHTAQQLFHSFI